MRSLVVDTSSVLHLFDTDFHNRQIRLLFEHSMEGRIIVYTPTFFLVETLNILLKKKKFSKIEANEFIQFLIKSNIRFVDFPSNRISDLLDVATKYRITAYDAHYIMLAQDLHCSLVTEDKELLAIRALGMSIYDYRTGS